MAPKRLRGLLEGQVEASLAAAGHLGPWLGGGRCEIGRIYGELGYLKVSAENDVQERTGVERYQSRS